MSKPVLTADAAKLETLGFSTQIRVVHAALKSERFDGMLTGAGVRRDDDHFPVFLQMVNVEHEHAPVARIAITTGPTESDVAALRWA